MGCQGGRGISSCALCALLLCALAWCAPAGASIAVDDVQVSESGAATFTVARQAGLLAPQVTVSLRTVDGSAVAPADYVAVSGALTFDALPLGGSQSRQVSVPITPDALDEPDETFRLVVAGAEVVDGEGTATIRDDDPPPSLSVADSAAVIEGAPGARASFVVGLSAPSGRAVAVSFATADGSAVAGQDYVAASGAVVVAPGGTQATVEVGVLDDALDEPAETFALRLHSPVAATLGDGAASATIVDDDDPPTPPAPPPSGSGQLAPPLAGPLPTSGASAPASGTGAGRTGFGLSSPRLRRPSTILVTIACPASAGRCSGRVTIFSIPNRRSRVKALRRERRLGRARFSLQGGRARTLALRLGRTDAALLKRTGRMRVRAYAITQDGAGRTGVRTVNGTLIARTAHSSPRSG